MKVVAAVGELEQEYGDRVDFVIVSAEDTKLRQDEIERFGFAEKMHGLVAFDADGEAECLLPGHNFGKEEIRAAVEAAIDG